MKGGCGLSKVAQVMYDSIGREWRKRHGRCMGGDQCIEVSLRQGKDQRRNDVLRYGMVITRWVVLWTMCLWVSAGEMWLGGIRSESRVRLVNPTQDESNVWFRAMDAHGQPMGSWEVVLQPFEGCRQNLTDQLGEFEGVITLRVDASRAIWVDTLVSEGDSDMLFQGQEPRQGPCLLAHVAEATSHWKTSLLLATSGAMSPVTWRHAGGLDTWTLERVHQAVTCDLEETFGSSIAPGTGWGVLDSLETRMAGWLTFMTEDGKQGAVVPLSLDQSHDLILPHIPSDTHTWWAGLVLVNTHDAALELDVRVHADDALIDRASWVVEPSTKRVGLLADFFDGALPLGASWIELRGNRSFSGLELFGTHNGETLAGLPLGAHLVKSAAFGRVGGKEDWSGIVLLNPGDRMLSITVDIFSDAGFLVESRDIALSPKAKTTLIPESWIANPTGSNWLRLRCSHGFVTFGLYGDRQQTRLTSCLPVEIEHDDIDLGLPMLCLETDENLWGRQAAYGDFDGDGVDELVTTTATDFVFVDVSNDETTQTHVPFSALEFDNPQDLEPGLFVADLDQDGQCELLVATDKLSFLTVSSSFEVTWFQDYAPPLEVDQTVRDCVDINGDDYLDVLCNRSLFQSILGVDDPYWRNTFPYMFQTTGRGSLFLPLDEDPRCDILTVLFDSFYAVLPGHLDPDPDPIYTPIPGKDILEIHKFDFDQDGREEVLSFLGQHAFSLHAQVADIARFSATGAEQLAQFEIPVSWGLSRLTPVPGESAQHLVLKQDQGNISRFWRADSTGIQAQRAQAWQGFLFDFNGDQIEDLVSPAGVILGQPSGIALNPALPFINASATSTEVRTFIDDYDGDQHNEVLALLKAPGGSYISVTLWEFVGDGTSVEPAYSFGVEASVIGFSEMRDMDGDGDLDLVLAGAGLFVFDNVDGTFSATPRVVHTPAVFSLTQGKKADFNNNGIIDLLAKTPLGGGSLEVITDILGAHPQVHSLNLHADIAYTDFRDVNDDGFVDILTYDPRRSAQVLYNNSGTSFTPMDIGMGVVHFTLNDFTGEGDLDLIGFVISADQEHSYLRLARNRGDGTFSGLMVIELPADTYYMRLLSVDFNADGRQDVLAFGSSEHSDTQFLDFWENRYTQALTEMPLRRISRLFMGHFGDAEMRDIDLDGRPDLQIYEPHQYLWFRQRTGYYPEFGVRVFQWP